MDASIGLQTTRKLLYWLKASLLNEERLLSKVPLIGPIKPIDPWLTLWAINRGAICRR